MPATTALLRDPRDRRGLPAAAQCPARRVDAARARRRQARAVREAAGARAAEDVDRVRAVARARERVVAEAFMYRHEPLFARVRRADGPRRHDRTGARSSTPASRSLRRREHDIRLDAGARRRQPVGRRLLRGQRRAAARRRCRPIEAFGWARAAPGGVDESFTGLLRFADGVGRRCTAASAPRIAPGSTSPAPTACCVCSNPFKPAPRETIDIDRGRQIEHHIVVEGSAQLFVRQIDDFVAAALDGRPPAMSLDDSRDIAAALAALHRSVERGPAGPAMMRGDRGRADRALAAVPHRRDAARAPCCCRAPDSSR